MANISTYQEELWLNDLKGTQKYCGIVSDAGTDEELEAGTLTNEITGYTGFRKAITFGAITQVGGKATMKNSAAIDFEVMPAPAGRQIKYAIVVDADGDPAWAGNIRYWCPLTVQKTWNAGDTFRIPIDSLVLDLA